MTDQPNYGFTSGPDPSQAGTTTSQEGNGLAVAGLVIGIIAVVLCFVPFLNWVLGILGIIFGGVGLSKANRIGGKNKGMAIAGLILGVVGLVLGTVIFVMALSAAKHDIERFNRMHGSIELVQPVQPQSIG
jgi:hypothetical protein